MRETVLVSAGEEACAAAALLERLRARGPRVHCITDGVAQSFTASVLLAMGCVPSMTLAAEEIESFVVRSDALVVGLGAFDRERREAAGIAVDTARRHKVPWVLDPVCVDRAPPRLDFAYALMRQAPRAVRLNLAEFAALARTEPSRDAAMRYACETRTALGLTGETDLVTDGVRVSAIANGDPLMAAVIAVGSAGSALVAACLAVESDPWHATTGALVMLGVAGERAAARAAGPGSFAVAMLDALYALDAPTLLAAARVRRA